MIDDEISAKDRNRVSTTGEFLNMHANSDSDRIKFFYMIMMMMVVECWINSYSNQKSKHQVFSVFPFFFFFLLLLLRMNKSRGFSLCQAEENIRCYYHNRIIANFRSKKSSISYNVGFSGTSEHRFLTHSI